MSSPASAPASLPAAADLRSAPFCSSSAPLLALCMTTERRLRIVRVLPVPGGPCGTAVQCTSSIGLRRFLARPGHTAFQRGRAWHGNSSHLDEYNRSPIESSPQSVHLKNAGVRIHVMEDAQLAKLRTVHTCDALHWLSITSFIPGGMSK